MRIIALWGKEMRVNQFDSCMIVENRMTMDWVTVMISRAQIIAILHIKLI